MVEGQVYPLLRWIVLLPLFAAAVHGVSLGWLRQPLSRTATNFISNRYAALTTTPGTLHTRSTYQAVGETVTVGYRANFSSSELPGTYSTSVTYTATAIP